MEKANLKAREYRFFSQKNQKMICLHSEQALAYARYLEEGEAFLPAYRKLLRATAVSDVEDVAGIAGIDLTQPEFWDKSLAMVAKDIDTFLALGEAKLAARADCGCRAGKES